MNNTTICHCPVCQSNDIEDISEYGHSNTSSGIRIWKETDKRRCNRCGVEFIPTDYNKCDNITT
jgi:hypothetical protein